MAVQEIIHPNEVKKILGKHLLTDGFDMVLDLNKSKGAYLYDSKSGKQYLDFFTFFASNPLGMNHEKIANDPDFVTKLGQVAINKPSNSDVYTEELAEFMESFSRVAVPSSLQHSFFISGGALAVENAMKVAFDWKVQKTFKKDIEQKKAIWFYISRKHFMEGQDIHYQ